MIYETVNLRDGVLFPVRHRTNPPYRKAGDFRCAQCLNDPECEEMLIWPAEEVEGATPEQFIEAAEEIGWFADKSGYVLCEKHNFKNKSCKRPDWSGREKRDAFFSIRDRRLKKAQESLKKKRVADAVQACHDDWAAADFLTKLAHDLKQHGVDVSAFLRGAQALNERADERVDERDSIRRTGT